MNIPAAERSIAQRLQDEIPELKVRPYAKQAEMATMIGKDGDILLRYADSVYAAPAANAQGAIVQTRTPRWQVVVRHRNLSPMLADQNAYLFLERVRAALTGFTVEGVPDATVLYPVQDGFIEEMDGIWAYGILFAMSAPEVRA